ncbi:hypothetical protein EZV62_023943 [Acer yangbiense]|uniref:DUF4283 domain-containing protein n=1 Tax=Acer yangbiense TaxID=1000413 RepID=A0A5C7H3Y6_9ROSI|nr:hypothetical protein EZV62_023943 [Acer yangbiense]
MESEDIACLCASLSIVDSDGPVRKLEESLKTSAINKMSLSLVGKILTRKAINREAFMRVIGRIWQVRKGVDIELVSGNTFTFHFRDTEDRRKVISVGPWSFDHALIAMEGPAGKGTLESMRFDHAEFWVQIHQVPLICMTRYIGWFWGEMIGQVIDVDGGTLRDCVGKFMRIRVRIDISKPLKRVLRVDIMGDGVGIVMLLRYERLASHCVKCGKVDHTKTDYSDPGTIQVVNEVDNPSFGIWLRASGPFRKTYPKYPFNRVNGACKVGTALPENHLPTNCNGLDVSVVEMVGIEVSETSNHDQPRDSVQVINEPRLETSETSLADEMLVGIEVSETAINGQVCDPGLVLHGSGLGLFKSKLTEDLEDQSNAVKEVGPASSSSKYDPSPLRVTKGGEAKKSGPAVGSALQPGTRKWIRKPRSRTIGGNQSEKASYVSNSGRREIDGNSKESDASTRKKPKIAQQDGSAHDNKWGAVSEKEMARQDDPNTPMGCVGIALDVAEKREVVGLIHAVGVSLEDSSAVKDVTVSHTLLDGSIDSHSVN